MRILSSAPAPWVRQAGSVLDSGANFPYREAQFVLDRPGGTVRTLSTSGPLIDACAG